jgi:biopolymer transport protein ExbD
MKNTRRMKRMARAKKHRTMLNLTSLMDVFTILVFFLLVNQSTTELLQPPKDIELPDSIVESKPRQTVVVFVSDDYVMVQGEHVASVADIIDSDEEYIAPMQDRLVKLQESVIGLNTALVAESREVTILADKTIPFKVLKKLMATCTASGYTRISLAVNQVAHQG